MPDSPAHQPLRSPRRRAAAVTILAVTGLSLAALFAARPAHAAEAPAGLGTAPPYSVRAGSTVTNTGPTTLSGSLGLSPGTAITGFPPGRTGGSRHAADADAGQAKSDLTIAYNDAAGRASNFGVAGDVVGRTFIPGVYTSSGPLALSGTLTFDGQGNPASVFIVQIAKTLITATASRVVAVNGAQACHIFWQVGSSATLGTASTFQGTIMAAASISVTTSAHVKGRALARSGAVTLDNDVFTSPDCANTTPPVAATATTTTVTGVPSSATAHHPVTVGATVRGAGTTPTGTVTFSDNGTPVGTSPLDSAGHARVTIVAGASGTTGTITAHYNGSPTSAPSQSPRVSLRVSSRVPPAPVVAASTSSPTPARSSVASRSPAAATVTTPDTLANTGTDRVPSMLGVSAALLLIGAMCLLGARRRYRARH